MEVAPRLVRAPILAAWSYMEFFASSNYCQMVRTDSHILKGFFIYSWARTSFMQVHAYHGEEALYTRSSKMQYFSFKKANKTNKKNTAMDWNRSHGLTAARIHVYIYNRVIHCIILNREIPPTPYVLTYFLEERAFHSLVQVIVRAILCSKVHLIVAIALVDIYGTVIKIQLFDFETVTFIVLINIGYQNVISGIDALSTKLSSLDSSRPTTIIKNVNGWIWRSH